MLQGLVVCDLCKYGYCGNTATGFRKHHYYSCSGTRVYANRKRQCDNKSIHANVLEKLAWEEVKYLLNNPYYLEKEYKRRIKELEKESSKEEYNKIKAEKLNIENIINKLIDSYTEGVIEKAEFNPCIKKYKQHLLYMEQKLLQWIDNQSQQLELQAVIGSRLEEFATKVRQRLEHVDWQTQRDMIVALVKRVEIGRSHINIIFKVDPCPSTDPSQNYLFEDCRKHAHPGIAHFHDKNLLKKTLIVRVTQKLNH